MNPFPDPIIKYAESVEDLERVKAIYRQHKQVLGFFPDGAFQERFERKQILVGREQDRVAGYVLFSVNQKLEVRIAHLAVAKESQGRGLSRLLVDRLKVDFSDHSRIRLNCRSDFEACGVWHRLGFTTEKRIPGRKASGSELVGFNFRLNEMPLFDSLIPSTDQPIIVCDANVCWDIHDSSRERHEHACGLLADWLGDEVLLAVTEEIRNDFDRIPEPRRSEMLANVRKMWETITPDITEVENASKLIRSILGPPKDESSVSDQRHLAVSIAAKATAFATYDEELLKKADDIFGLSGLRVQTPPEIISEIDSIVRANNYNYRELKNTGVERRRAKSLSDIEIEDFVDFKNGEVPRKLASLLNQALSLPDKFEIIQLRGSDERNLALTVADRSKFPLISIPVFRIARRLVGSRLGNIIAELLAFQPLGEKRGQDCNFFRITDHHLESVLEIACLRHGFQACDGQYFRMQLPGFWEQTGLLTTIQGFISNFEFPDNLGRIIQERINSSVLGSLEDARLVENLIHPGKLFSEAFPTYIVPIQPQWAAELFDPRIWTRPLLPIDTRLVLNPDSVYYKRPRNSPRENLARILWYVSGNKKQGGRCIRAISLMTKGVTGTVKDLFREYHRLGVFEWRQLMDHFKSSEAMAFALEFSNTELFPSPISLDDVNSILLEQGMKRQQFVSAVKVPLNAFKRIYMRGFGTE